MYIFGVWMDSLDRKPKRCRTSSSLLEPCSEDRLTSLPDDLLTRILSILPTKDAAATQVLSKRMKRPFRWISSIDLDDSHISYCVQRPHLIERFALFESFIDNVLHKLSESSSQQPLTRFRLHLGGDNTILPRRYYNGHKCKKAYCFPDPQPARIYAWISYPLAHDGLRELDLSVRVKNPKECKLPPEIFACRSLEVLRLDIKLKITGESGDNEIPIIFLPNLKLLHLRSFVFTEDNFVTRLVSNCPVLEDLSITYCRWLKADRLIISSHSLRRFVFIIDKYNNDIEKNSDLLHIDAPNLQYFDYFDNLALNYILHLNDLVEACIDITFPLRFGTFETSFRKQLSLLRALSNVKHLSLLGWSIQIFYYYAKLKDRLPMFRNLRTLKLGELCDQLCNTRWDIVLLLIFDRAPLLEELVFIEGFFSDPDYTCVYHAPNHHITAPYEAAWEADKGVTRIIPSCFEFHLKRIRIYNCHGRDQELNMMRFLLGKASVLKEFVISMSKRPGGVLFDALEYGHFKNELEKIPRASNSCSIIYSDDEPNYD
ncbi:F-box/LRR-repeat protein At4g14103-like [Silene latifolia]|uniref:F-box/LRR-repeat protein At4g14103-like n=1 Tax=Silene latifolia TaxID=37657 RepID=UPI003D77549C